jgi:hypothetical protein
VHAGADRLSLFAQVVALLRERGVPFAVVGAAALAAHGVSRATRDVDVLVVDPACLSEATWAPLQSRGVILTVRRGSAEDPLAGVIRLTAADESPIDLVVGKEPWQAAAEALRGDATDRAALVAEVEAALLDLPADARRLWSRVVESR